MKILFTILLIMSTVSCITTQPRGDVTLGMDKEEVLQAWGQPRNINQTSYGDQWTYGNKYTGGIRYQQQYLYFDKYGVLTDYSYTD